MTPIAVTIAGSDSSGGAGIQADLKTFSALGVYGASVITALTAQNTLGVQQVFDVPADFVAAQISSVFSDLAVGAVKIGMLSRSEVIETVAEEIDRFDQQRLVLDPVMVATSGDPLIDEDAVDALRELLIPRAMIITPNLAEAARLLDTDVAEDEADLVAQVEALFDLGPRAVLLKGGHGEGEESADIFYDGTEPLRLAAKRADTANTHGSGCTLSAAIAALLAQDLTLIHAVAHAKSYVTDAIFAADELSIGSGHGPLHHFHNIWGKVPLFGKATSGGTEDAPADDEGEFKWPYE
jgi:hydroxymethylpyrimidine/phosphomethylpyrimidine kinase